MHIVSIADRVPRVRFMRFFSANRICKEEIEALSEMAHQINSKLQHQPAGDVNSNMTPLANGVHRQSSESVDLDNLFAFLSEVNPGGNGTNSNSNSDNVSNNNSSLIMDDLEEKMDNLVHDLDAELENVLQQEIEGLSLGKTGSKSDSATSTLTRNSAKLGVPSLPEPTMKPPPPPKVKPNQASAANCTMGLANETSVETVPFSKPPQIPPANKVNKVNRLEEPIYEAVIPRQELSVVHEIPEPPSHEHKLRPKSPAVQAMRSSSPQQQRNSAHALAPSSPKQIRPNSRAANPVVNLNQINGQPNQFANGFERAERRKHRVEKKLQEMQQTDVTERERDGLRDDVYSDFLEFAESHFNTHERTPEGTIMATLTRKGRKSVDLVPKYEMVTYYKGNSIQSSHIHMYDPENVTVACNIFKVQLAANASAS